MGDEMEKIYESETTQIYRTSCDCMSDEHIVTIVLENDRGFKTMSFNYKCYLKGYHIGRKYCDTFKEWFFDYAKYILESIIYRIKTSLKVLFTGYVEMDGDFIFRDSKQILAMVEAMIDLVKANPPKTKE